MKRAIFALVLSLIVAGHAAAQTPAPAAASRAEGRSSISVRDAIAENDFRRPSCSCAPDMKAIGRTPLAIRGLLVLGRGALAAKKYDVAMTYAAPLRTRWIEQQLKTRQLDDESHLPIALGAAIECRRSRSRDRQALEAVMTLQREDRALQGHVDHHAPQQEL
jgi:hypothetical protein